MTRGTITLAGALAQKARHGGHVWVPLQYLLGFKRLGWDVLFLDRLLTSVGGGVAPDAAVGLICSSAVLTAAAVRAAAAGRWS